MIIPTPCNVPKIMYPQVGPCQIPDMIKTINVTIIALKKFIILVILILGNRCNASKN